MTTFKAFVCAQWECSQLEYWLAQFIKATDYKFFGIAGDKPTICKACEVNQEHEQYGQVR